MKNIFSAFICVIVFTTFVFGSFLYLPIEERVKESNLIITGTLIDVSETETEDLKIEKGTLVIEEVIYGNFTSSIDQSLKSGDKVQVEWRNSKMFACQFGFPENKKEIWFLKVDNEGNIELLTNNTATSLSEIAEVRKYLKKQKRVDRATKTIKLQNDVPEISQANSTGNNNSETKFCIYDAPFKLNKQKESYPFSALLVILGSFGLYFVLYRSRFKIR